MPEKNRFPAVLQPILHWDGSEIHPTLNQSAKGSGGVGASNQELFSQGGAYLVPGQVQPFSVAFGAAKLENTAPTIMANGGPNRHGEGSWSATQFTGVIQPAIPFRKSKRAASTTDDETWVPADASNTLNNFDLGDTRTTHAVVEPKVYENHPNDSRVTGPLDVAPTVVSRFGTGGGNVPFVNNEPVAFQPGNLRRQAGADPSTETFPTLKCDAGDQSPHVCHPVIGFSGRDNGADSAQEISPTLRSCSDPKYNRSSGWSAAVAISMAVRRLTPEECEALQGFPKGYSRIPWKGKPAEECPDGPRYKACGNSMAVPVMRWIGERIAQADAKHFSNA